MYYGRYGLLGYVELVLDPFSEHVEIGGIVEVPGPLWDAIKELDWTQKGKGIKALLTSRFFNDYEPKKEELDHPSLKGIPLFYNGYYWHATGYSIPSDGFSGKEIIDFSDERVRELILEFEDFLDRMVPLEKRPFTVLDFKQLPR